MAFNLIALMFRSVIIRKFFNVIMVSVISLLLLTLVVGQNIQSQEPTNAIYNVSSLAYSPDGTKIAVGGGKQDCVGDPINPGDISNYGIRILETATGQVLNTLEGHTCSTNMISWDPSGVYLASSGNDGSIRVWDVANGNNISIYGASGSDGEAEPFEGITWNPGSSQIATFQGRAILILDPFTSQLIKRVTDAQDRSRITTIAWDPSGDLLAAGTLSDQIKIWNVATGNLDQPLLSFGTTPVSSIAWSPDGSRIVTGGVDGILRVFDAASGQMLASFPGNTQSAPSIAWSDDGSRIASASWDNAVRVWDAESGYQLDVFSNSTSVYAVAWSPDGITLAYGGARDVTVTIVTPSVAIPTPTPTHSPTPIPSAIGSIISEVGAIMLVLLQQPGRIMR